MDDFDREVWCLLGLGFDAVDLVYATTSLREAAINKTKCLVSTPNLNFIVVALKDAEFRQTVIDSDLNLLDGMPLLWIARLLGTGLQDKVSGSDFFDELMSATPSGRDRLKIYFFGGETGIAERACNIINSSVIGLHCVGYHDPGFGSVEDLSDPGIIERINSAGADFLVLALGARKGQIWIGRNWEKLSVPIVSHLGAVLNFVAGNVKRAPVWMQTSGFEWIWRIVQEPVLWRRYSKDGLVLATLFFSRVLPYLWWKTKHAHVLESQTPVKFTLTKQADGLTISIQGSCTYQTINPLREIFRASAANVQHIKLDLSGVPACDGAFIGLCLVLLKRLDAAGRRLEITGLNADMGRVFHWNCVEYLL